MRNPQKRIVHDGRHRDRGLNPTPSEYNARV